jgi:hypothetical protein
MQTTQAPKELEVFGQLQRNLGEATMQLVATAVRTPWKELSLEMRTSPDGTSRGMKLRVTPVSGALIAVRPTRAVGPWNGTGCIGALRSLSDPLREWE